MDVLTAAEHALRVADEVNRLVAQQDWRVRADAAELRNRFRRVEGNVPVPRFGKWYSPA